MALFSAHSSIDLSLLFAQGGPHHVAFEHKQFSIRIDRSRLILPHLPERLESHRCQRLEQLGEMAAALAARKLLAQDF